MRRIPDALYEQIKSLIPIACVDLVVLKDSRILLCKRNNEPAKGEWWVPGGRVLIGETLKEAVFRKAKEELGIDVSIVRQVGTYDNIFPDVVHTVTTVFLVKPFPTEIKLDSQHSECKWFRGDKLPKLQDMLLRELADAGVLMEHVCVP